MYHCLFKTRMCFKPEIARDHVGLAVGGKATLDLRQPIRFNPASCVGDGEVGACCCGNTQVAPFCNVAWLRNYAEQATCRIVFENFTGAVCACAIDDEDFVRRPIL